MVGFAKNILSLGNKKISKLKKIFSGEGIL